MFGFLVRRFLWFLITTWIVITVSFFLMRQVPGGPFSGERNDITLSSQEAPPCPGSDNPLSFKTYDPSRVVAGKTMEEHLNASLKRMNTDYLDLWQVHSVANPDDVDTRIEQGVFDRPPRMMDRLTSTGPVPG